MSIMFFPATLIVVLESPLTDLMIILYIKLQQFFLPNLVWCGFSLGIIVFDRAFDNYVTLL